MIDALEHVFGALYTPFVIASYLVAVFSIGISAIPKRVPILSSRFIGIVVGLIAVGSGFSVYWLLTGTYGLGTYAWVSGNCLFLLGSLFRIPDGKEGGTGDTDP